jgi:hypothetical protein
MQDDDRITAVLQRAARTLEPDTAKLVAGGLARGRRRRRLVRGAEALSAFALLAGVAGLAAALLPFGGGAGRGSAGHSAPVGGSGPVSTVAPTVLMSPQALVQTAVDLLPRPGATSAYGGNAMDGSVTGRFVYDDGHGAAQIFVALAYPSAAPTPKSALAAAGCVAGSAGCQVLADGAHAQIRQGHQYSDGRQPNPAEWGLDLVRSDGVTISFSEWNAPQPKGAALTRDEPPFTPAELIAWADSPSWQVRIPQARADAAAGLFSADDLTVGPSNPAPTDAGQERKICLAAESQGKTPPGYCKHH